MGAGPTRRVPHERHSGQMTDASARVAGGGGGRGAPTLTPQAGLAGSGAGRWWQGGTTEEGRLGPGHGERSSGTFQLRTPHTPPWPPTPCWFGGGGGGPTADPRPRMWKLRREGGRCHKVSFLVDARGVEREERPRPGHRRASATGPSRKEPQRCPGQPQDQHWPRGSPLKV